MSLNEFHFNFKLLNKQLQKIKKTFKIRMNCFAIILHCSFTESQGFKNELYFFYIKKNYELKKSPVHIFMFILSRYNNPLNHVCNDMLIHVRIFLFQSTFIQYPFLFFRVVIDKTRLKRSAFILAKKKQNKGLHPSPEYKIGHHSYQQVANIWNQRYATQSNTNIGIVVHT